MKTSNEKKEDITFKGIHKTKKEIKVGTVSIRYENNRLSHVYIAGKFDFETIKETIIKYPDSEWVSFVLDTGIDISSFNLSGDPKNHEEVHKKIMKLIRNLDNVTYLNIQENGTSGSVLIETVSANNQDKITINYVFDTIEKVELVFGASEKTKKAVTEVLGIPNLDKISPPIKNLTLEGDLQKSLNQQVLDFLNTLNESCELSYKNGTGVIRLKTSDEFLYFNNKLYPVVIGMKEMYPRIVKFLPKEVTAILDKFSGHDTVISIKASSKKDYEKVLLKALTVLSKISPPVPKYFTFDRKWFLTIGVAIQGSYEKLDVNFNLLFQPEAHLLKPLRMIVYDNKRKAILIYRQGKSNKEINLLLELSKKFLRTEAITKYPDESQNPQSNNISYYLLEYGNYYIVTNKELLPTVLYNLPKFAK